ncbi:PREDICTED: FAST kinase domain-containing protein 3 [Elephantulus edwardii]|uniref:FAST kinase domain-containing protein 3 n=1 Tax=Elephantulus edwardii TaxID=28737 RepID=UPI0003F07115|nr:PREDICTED: FAST kinase domain-containing protein 3 [Elephantulus edwardii]
MASAALRRKLCDFRFCGALATLKGQSVSHVHTAVTSHPCWGIFQQRPSRASYSRTCYLSFLSEPRSKLQPEDQPVFPPVPEQGRTQPNPSPVDGQRVPGRLATVTRWTEALHLLNTEETQPDAGATGAVPPLWEVRRMDAHEGRSQDVPTASCPEFERDPGEVTDAGLVALLQALAVSHVAPPSSVLDALVAECQKRVQTGSLSVQQLCALGGSLIALLGPGCVALDLVIAQLQGVAPEALSAEDVVAIYRMLQACPGQVDQHQALLTKLHCVTLALVSGLSPTAISQVLSALVTLDQTQALPLVLKLSRYAVRHIPRFSSQALGCVLEAFIHFGLNDRFFTAGLERHVQAQGLTLSPEAASHIASYCGQKLILSAPILDVVAESFVAQPGPFSPEQLVRLVEPFGTLGYLPPNAPAFFAKLERSLSAHLRDFPPKALLRLLHACSLLGRHPINFMPKIFSPYFLQQLQGEEPQLDRVSLAQLTQLFLSSILECPFYKGPKLLPKYQVKSFFTPCCSVETPLDFQLYKSVISGLIQLLGARTYFGSRVLTPSCYTIDVEIKLDREGFVLPYTAYEDVHKRVVLCIDDPKRFCSNTNHLLGKEAIKQRHLHLLGYDVVQIPYHETKLLKSTLELVEYLQRKLFAQNGRSQHAALTMDRRDPGLEVPMRGTKPAGHTGQGPFRTWGCAETPPPPQQLISGVSVDAFQKVSRNLRDLRWSHVRGLAAGLVRAQWGRIVEADGRETKARPCASSQQTLTLPSMPSTPECPGFPSVMWEKRKWGAESAHVGSQKALPTGEGRSSTGGRQLRSAVDVSPAGRNPTTPVRGPHHPLWGPQCGDPTAPVWTPHHPSARPSPPSAGQCNEPCSAQHLSQARKRQALGIKSVPTLSDHQTQQDFPAASWAVTVQDITL